MILRQFEVQVLPHLLFSRSIGLVCEPHIVRHTKNAISDSSINTIEASNTWCTANKSSVSHELLSVDKLLHIGREVEVKIAHMYVICSILCDNTSAEAREVNYGINK